MFKTPSAGSEASLVIDSMDLVHAAIKAGDFERALAVFDHHPELLFTLADINLHYIIIMRYGTGKKAVWRSINTSRA